MSSLFSTVVFITSNYIGNSEIMQGCKEAGIPAFGTLWDFVRCSIALYSRPLGSLGVIAVNLPVDDLHATTHAFCLHAFFHHQ